MSEAPGNCPNCSTGIVASAVMAVDDVFGVYKQCRSCKYIVRDETQEEPGEAVEEPRDAAPEPVKKTRAARAKPVAPEASLGQLDVVKAARERLKFVKSEIRRLRKLEKEEATLSKMLEAAAGPKRKRKTAIVTQLQGTK